MTSGLVVRFVEKFPEPGFADLQREIFAPLEHFSEEFDAAVHEGRANSGSVDRATLPPMVRFGAYSGEQLVGWTIGWFQRPDRFVMSNSGVVPAHRRCGVYSRLVETIADYARLHGAGSIHSWHSVLNSPVSIAKLKLGFIIEGTQFSDHLGLQVQLVRHTSQARAEVFRVRLSPFSWPSDV